MSEERRAGEVDETTAGTPAASTSGESAWTRLKAARARFDPTARDRLKAELGMRPRTAR